jgi:hypothetical protein
VPDALRRGRQTLGQAMSISISKQKNRLKEKHAGGPNTGRTPKPGRNGFSHYRLDEKE